MGLLHGNVTQINRYRSLCRHVHSIVIRLPSIPCMLPFFVFFSVSVPPCKFEMFKLFSFPLTFARYAAFLLGAGDPQLLLCCFADIH